MAQQIDTLNIGGRLVSWSHSYLVFEGDEFRGLTSIAWDESTEVTLGYAMTKDHAPIGFSAQKYVPGELKIKGKVHAIAQLRDWWANKAADGKSYGSVILASAMLQWDMGPGTPEQTVEWRDLVWKGNSNSNEESADPREEEITIAYRLCIRNGKTLYDSSQET